MEFAALASHGASEMIIDRSCAASDGKAGPHMPVPHCVREGAPGQMYVCENCNMRCDTARSSKGWCNLCKSSRAIKSVAGVQVWDTLVSELASLGIGVQHTLTPIETVPRA